MKGLMMADTEIIFVSHYSTHEIMIGVSWCDGDKHPCLQALIVRGLNVEHRRYNEEQTKAIMSDAERYAIIDDNFNDIRKYYAEVIADKYTQKGEVQ